MPYLTKRERYSLLNRLKGRIKALSQSPIYQGKTEIERINLDDLVVEMALKFCDTDKVLARIKESRELKDYAHKEIC